MQPRISTEATLLQRLSQTHARRIADAPNIKRLAGAANETQVIETAMRQRLLLLAAARLEATVGEEDRMAALSARARTRMQVARVRAMLFRATSGHVTETLERAGIPSMPLKGVTLAARIYDDEALRETSDVDVLVPTDRLREAVEVCRQLDYEPIDPDLSTAPLLHHVLSHRTNRLPAVEIHWRVHWYEDRFAEEMLGRSTMDRGVRTAEPLDELASLLLFYERDGFVGLRLATDLATWWDRYGADVPAGGLAGMIRAYPDLGSAWTAAALVAQATVGLPASHLLGRPLGVSRRVAIATRLANWPIAGDSDQISAEVTLVDALCTPPGERQAFVRRTLLGDAEWIRRVYRLPEDAPIREWVWRTVHPFKLCLRYFLAILRISLRGRQPTRPDSH